MDLPKFTSNKKKGEGFEEFGEKLSFSKILIVTLVWRLKSYSLHIEMSGLVSTLSSKFKKILTITTLIFLSIINRTKFNHLFQNRWI